MEDIVSCAWRAVNLGTHMVVCLFGSSRIWGVLDTTSPTRGQMAEAFGRAMWERARWLTEVGATL